MTKMFTMTTASKYPGSGDPTTLLAWGIGDLWKTIESASELPEDRSQQGLFEDFRAMNPHDVESWETSTWDNGFPVVAYVVCHGDSADAEPDDDWDGPGWEPPKGIEVFYRSEGENQIEEWKDRDGNTIPGGWFWWPCQPGCMPDTDCDTAAEAANGPFDTHNLACKDAWSE